MTTIAFSSLQLDPALVANLDSMGYEAMTPVQAQSLPVILQGKDLIVQAETGSGKTAAFGIGLLTRLNTRRAYIQALVLCPTRELADQVGKEIRRLASVIPNIKLLMLCGGVPYGPQSGSLKHGAHIIVGTPGRVLKHLRKGSLDLGQLQTLVLDEADRMLDMGFYDDMAEIISATPVERQTLLFSATFPDTIKQISASMQKNPERVCVKPTHTPNRIEQVFYEVAGKGERGAALVTLLGHYSPASCVVFCNTKQQCQEVADTLSRKGFSALALHGDLEQRERDQVLVQFSNRSCSILVATDVAARGLDIKDLEVVINFELSQDPEVHVHRIGRTGRAGKSGLALGLYIAAESHRVNAIEDYQQSPLEFSDIGSLKVDEKSDRRPPMVTLCIDGGRKSKVRPGDILGALTNASGIAGDQVGKIDIFDRRSYVAIERDRVDKALQQLTSGKIKGRYFKASKLR
ncbi:ATP-dependent RNA helicase DbpA [Thiogranum longum]|uniref:ATP-dependent RNA helicase DbpA n=1 Tax=Thiogranum longum TaxID=1537524 RepID=A0A4R1H8G2_9GAMM|nr:ATP-dependent RNA helicase DbpA [Thiogranum longum]TCK18127.1 ATP-dependent RNA helicase DbpA [Thiogranum longum]